MKVYTIGLTTSQHDASYPDNAKSHTAPAQYIASTYNKEYDLWQIADTSATYGGDYGGYYYCTDPTLLTGVFDDIFTSVTTGGGSTTRGLDSNGTGADQTGSSSDASGSTYAQSRGTRTVVLNEGFEGGAGTWVFATTGAGSSSSIAANAPRSGTYCVYMYGPSSSSLGYRANATRAVSLAGYTSGTLTFYWRGNSFDNANEKAEFLMYYDNDGAGANPKNWYVVATMTNTLANGAYYLVTIPLTANMLAAGATFQIRFQLYCDKNDDYLRIDDIYLNCGPTAPDTPVFFAQGGSPDSANPDIPYTTPLLQWTYSDYEGDLQTQYQVQVMNYPAGTVVWDSTILTSGLHYVTCTVPLSYGSQYSWTVRVNDGTGAGWSGWGPSSGNWYFTVRALPAAPLINSNKTATTETFSIVDANTAILSFRQQYNIISGANGLLLEVGFYNTTTSKWCYHYATPTQPYTSNLLMSVAAPKDNYGADMRWCWNGVSGQGTYGWEYVAVDLLPYVPTAFRANVRVKFCYYEYEGSGVGGTGDGWHVDNVEVKVTATTAAVASTDVWSWKTGASAYSGTGYWWNGNPTTPTELKPGIDDSLISKPIDLTRAVEVTLNARFAYNVNQSASTPPDGMRIEVTQDGGLTWKPINYGVRSFSGTTGAAATPTYVQASTESRINCDLSGWSGYVVQLRFRVVTNNLATASYHHYDKTPGWGGIYLDDVTISGTSLTDTRSSHDTHESASVASAIIDGAQLSTGPKAAFTIEQAINAANAQVLAQKQAESGQFVLSAGGAAVSLNGRSSDATPQGARDANQCILIMLVTKIEAEVPKV